ncbi:hypothetical protein AGMMS49992_29740 [Clostridia bacterium]|nr:hypothetical protein AGMMS49992_29740 [Clostridia bacterium]
MLNKEKLISDCLATVGWPYSSPGSNDERGIDCSGMFCRAYKLQGASIYHGSNRIIRTHCRGWQFIKDAANLEPGMAVFKRRDDGQEGNEYKPGGQYYNPQLVGNFYHVGLVVSVNPLKIVHCTDPIAKVDTKLGAWTYAGYLKDVAYAAAMIKPIPVESSPVEQLPVESNPVTDAAWHYAVVSTPGGGRLNLRRAPTTAVDNRVGYAPNGAQLAILETRADGWARVQYLGVTAFAQTMYLRALPDESKG